MRNTKTKPISKAIVGGLLSMTSALCFGQIVNQGITTQGITTFGTQSATESSFSLAPIKGFTAGGSNTVLYREDGSFLIFGANQFGQCNVPPSLALASLVVPGKYHTLAITNQLNNGQPTVVAWGLNSFGQCKVPASATNVVSVAAGDVHSLALTKAGTVIAWGSNGSGQLNVPAGLTGVTQITASTSASGALKADGSVITWGNNSEGQLNVPAGLRAVQLVSGDTFFAALKSNGEAVTWGTLNGIAVPGKTFKFNEPIKKIAAGAQFLVFQLKSGVVKAVGNNDQGQLNVTTQPVLDIAASNEMSHWIYKDQTSNILDAAGDMTQGNAYAPQPAFDPWPLLDFATGGTFTLGRRSNLVLVDSGPKFSKIPSGVWAKEVSKFAAGPSYALAIVQGKIYAWEYTNTSKELLTPPAGTTFTMVAAGYTHALAFDSKTQKVVAWGSNAFGECNVPANLPNDIVSIVAGQNYSGALTKKGKAYIWGAALNSDVPAEVKNGFVAQLAAGGQHTVAVMGTKTIAWGNNDNYQCDVPTDMAQSAVAGGEHTIITYNLQPTPVGFGLDDDGQIEIDSRIQYPLATSACLNRTQFLPSCQIRFPKWQYEPDTESTANLHCYPAVPYDRMFTLASSSPSIVIGIPATVVVPANHTFVSIPVRFLPGFKGSGFISVGTKTGVLAKATLTALPTQSLFNTFSIKPDSITASPAASSVKASLTFTRPILEAGRTVSISVGSKVVVSNKALTAGTKSIDSDIPVSPVAKDTKQTVTATLKVTSTWSESKSVTLLQRAPVFYNLSGKPEITGGSTGKYDADFTGYAAVDAKIVAKVSDPNVTIKDADKLVWKAGTSTVPIYLVASDKLVSSKGTLTVTCNGVTKTYAVTVVPKGITIAEFTPTPAKVVGGMNLNLKIVLSRAAPKGGVNVKLTSASTDLINPVSTVFFKEGTTMVNVTCTTKKTTVKKDVKLGAYVDLPVFYVYPYIVTVLP